jgi:hypothetical protein
VLFFLYMFIHLATYCTSIWSVLTFQNYVWDISKFVLC